MTTDMNQAYEPDLCLDMCGRVLLTQHEQGGGICWHCLSAGHASFSPTEVEIWHMQDTTSAPWEDDDGYDMDEVLCMLINRGLASIWPSPNFDEPEKAPGWTYVFVDLYPVEPGMTMDGYEDDTDGMEY